MRAPLAIAILLLMAQLGCVASRYRKPALMATAGALLGGGGGITYAVGDRKNSDALMTSGAISMVVGVGLMFAAGVWAAAASQCDAQADCLEAEYCQVLYTSAGPLGHCVAR